MRIIKSIIVAFSMYSRIPMPQFAWKDEDMKYMLCFFPWVGAVTGFCLFLWGVLSGKLLIGQTAYILIATAIPASDHRGLSCGWLYGYHGCLSLLSAQGAEAGDHEGFSHWCFFCDLFSASWNALAGGNI